MKTVSAAKFKNQCLALLAEVERTRSTLVVTRRGRPVAKIAPIAEVTADDENPLRDSIEFQGDLVSPIGSGWHALR